MLKLIKLLFLASVCFSADRFDLVVATGGDTISGSSVTEIISELSAVQKRESVKWGSGATLGNKVYGIPYVADQILMLNSESGAVSAAGSTRSVATINTEGGGSNKWSGAVIVNDVIFGIPHNADRLLIFTPKTGKITGSVTTNSIATGGGKWRGGVTINNMIYGIPYDAEQLLVYNPAKNEVHGIAINKGIYEADHSSRTSKWKGAVVIKGVCYGIPFRTKNILIFDPKLEAGKQLSASPNTDAFIVGKSGAYRWSGGVAVNGVLYCIPVGADRILIYNPETNVLSGSEPTDSIATGDWKWDGGVLIGTRIYGIPNRANNVLIFDTVTQLVSGSAAIPSDIDTGKNQWVNGVGIGSKVYGFPARADKVLIYETLPPPPECQIDGLITRPLFSLDVQDGGVSTAAVSPSEQSVATASSNGVVQAWNATSGALIRTFDGHASLTTRMQCMEISSSEKYLVAGTDNMKVVIWNFQTGELIRIIDGAHTAQVITCAISNSEEYIVTGEEAPHKSGRGGRVQIFKLLSGEKVFEKQLNSYHMRSVVVAPSDEFMVTGTHQGLIQVWDFPSGAPSSPSGIPKLLGGDGSSGGAVVAMAISHSEKYLAVVGENKALVLFDLTTWSVAHKIPAHERNIKSVAFMKSDEFLATISDDGTAKIWCLKANAYWEKYDLVRTFDTAVGHVSSHKYATMGVADSGRFLVTGFHDGTAKIWDALSGCLDCTAGANGKPCENGGHASGIFLNHSCGCLCTAKFTGVNCESPTVGAPCQSDAFCGGSSGGCITHCCAAPMEMLSFTNASNTSAASHNNHTATNHTPTQSCATECSSDRGLCYLPLTLSADIDADTDTSETWTAADAANLDLPARLEQNRPFVSNSLDASRLFKLARRQRFDGAINGTTASQLDRQQLQLVVRWTREGAASPSADAYGYIGGSPPFPIDSDPSTILLHPDDADTASPGGLVYVGEQDGKIIASPEKAGNYTAWILVYDPAGERLAKSSLHNLKHAELWSQAVVAVWNFEVGGKLPFAVQGYNRVADAEYSDGTGFITTTGTTMALNDCVVGSTYKIAPIDLDTLTTKNARKGLEADELIYSFVLEGAPRGFFVDTSNGEIIGVPTMPTARAVTAKLFVVDGSGDKALLQTISIAVGKRPTFVLSAGPSRLRAGKEYTDPATASRQYFVDENYLIAPLQVNSGTTLPSSGTVDDIKFTLVGAPETWFISADSGIITGKFNATGNYNFSIVAVDAGGQKDTVEEYTFVVAERGTFRVLNYAYSQMPSGTSDLNQSDYTDPSTTTTYAVGETYRFPPIDRNLLETENPNDTSDLTFAVQGAPPGLLINPADGYIQATPTTPGDFTVTLNAENSRNEKAKIAIMTMVIKYNDGDMPINGPNRAGCANGKPVDGVPFDRSFTCNCDGTQFEGLNCELDKPGSAGSSAQDAGGGDNVGAVVGAMVAGMIVLAAAGIMIYKRRVYKLSMRAHNFEVHLHELLETGEIDAPASDGGDGGQRVPREIKRDHITMTAVVGAGAFGEVWKAVLDESKAGGVPGYMCAVKTSKEAKGDGADELLREALVMAQLTGHPNVVSLIGVVTSGVPLLLLLSLCENGSLQSCLKEGTCPGQANLPGTAPSNASVLKMALEIARGMKHLVDGKFVHRDLAARNVLLDSEFVCKVADFGLSRGVAASNTDDENAKEYYTSRNGTFPVRWTSPEAIETMKFSTATDIWSYAVVLLEIVTGGRRPYDGMRNEEVVQKVMAGYRAPRPEPGCSVELYAVMLDCWNDVAGKRPSFTELVSALEQLQQHAGGNNVGGDGAGGSASAAAAAGQNPNEYLMPGVGISGGSDASGEQPPVADNEYLQPGVGLVIKGSQPNTNSVEGNAAEYSLASQEAPSVPVRVGSASAATAAPALAEYSLASAAPAQTGSQWHASVAAGADAPPPATTPAATKPLEECNDDLGEYAAPSAGGAVIGADFGLSAYSSPLPAVEKSAVATAAKPTPKPRPKSAAYGGSPAAAAAATGSAGAAAAQTNAAPKATVRRKAKDTNPFVKLIEEQAKKKKKGEAFKGVTINADVGTISI